MENNPKLPGYNCGQCQQATCNDLLRATKRGRKNTCPFIDCEQPSQVYRGVLIEEEADFILHPLKGMQSCVEYILPLCGKPLKPNDYVRYRPCGCPITHFAKVKEFKDGILEIEMVGPQDRLKGANPIELGICLVLGFEGEVEGNLPRVGQTVRFIPHKCMMKKVHQGIIVAVYKRNIRIEGIDLKIQGMKR